MTLEALRYQREQQRREVMKDALSQIHSQLGNPTDYHSPNDTVGYWLWLKSRAAAVPLEQLEVILQERHDGKLFNTLCEQGLDECRSCLRCAAARVHREMIELAAADLYAIGI